MYSQKTLIIVQSALLLTLLGIAVYGLKSYVQQNSTVWFASSVFAGALSIFLFRSLFAKSSVTGRTQIRLNRSIPSQRQSVVALFEKAEKEVFIYSGCLDHNIYESPEVIRAINKMSKKNISIKVVLDSDIDQKTLTLVKMVRESDGSIKKIFRKPKKHPNHAIIVDGIHVRLEEPHSDTEDRPAYIRYFDEKFATRVLITLNVFLKSEDVSVKDVSAKSASSEEP